MIPESLVQFLSIEDSHPVSGGDINATYRVRIKGESFFLKLNDAKPFPDMFIKEAAGLKAIDSTTTLKTPQVINVGIHAGYQYLILEWQEGKIRSKSFWEDFGAGLAGMHRIKQKYFGWEEDNYIGSLPQVNTKTESWSAFYSEHRILPLAKQLLAMKRFSIEDLRSAENFCRRLPELFPQEPPSLLHGDLWSGNFLTNNNGETAVIDPAVYCGHREMDIGMSLLFGGFDQRFYDAYNDYYPLENGWTERVQFAQLYPLMVHAVLFGGGYVRSARNVLEEGA